MKKQVELKLFEDMVKYVKGFKPCNLRDYDDYYGCYAYNSKCSIYC